MKANLIFGLAMGCSVTLTAQVNNGAQLLEVSGKRYHFYIALQDSLATVFKMTYWLDKAGQGYTIQYADTLKAMGNGNYNGATTRIENNPDAQYLVFAEQENSTTTKKAVIKPVAYPAKANQEINNGYWYSHFFRLSDSINSRFPWHHYSFRKGIPEWKTFSNKDTPWPDFFVFANGRIQALRDSIAAVHTQHTGLTQWLLSNISTIEYDVLSDSLKTLPPGLNADNRYFGLVIQAVCDKRPEFFFRLADDMPKVSSDIFYFGSSDKAMAKKLLAVNTNSPSKKAFKKELRLEKGFKIKAAVIYGGLLGLGIYALVK